jgi:hypothetical protein
LNRIQVRNANIVGAIPNQSIGTTGSLTGYFLLGTGALGSGGFDYRVPFESLINPNKYISNVSFIDMEPHQSAGLNITASWDGSGDNLYELMANNFLAEVPEFFLEDGEMTSLVSEPQSTFKQFEPGKKYSMRVKLRRSYNSPRVFESNYPTPQNNYLQVAGVSGPVLAETLTMYSRPSSFGPPMASIEYVDTGSITSAFRPSSLFAYDLAFTPPYYDGESWADIIFTATSTKHTLEDVFGSSSIKYWRVDSSSGWPAGTIYQTTPYGEYANNFAMQLSASFNIFGKQPIRSADYDSLGNLVAVRDDKQSSDQVWIIQSKFETPILNFNEQISFDSMSIPVYGSESVARGMWHQFGKIPTDPDVGVFLELTDIDRDWMVNRAFEDPTLATLYGSNTSEVGQLLDVIQFRKKRAKLGKLASSKTVYEAVVAIPFLERDGQRKFFELDRSLVTNAISIVDSVLPPQGATVPGKTLTDLITKMKKYVLPPTFDFYTNQEVDPISMFIFEFSHTFTKNDLSYMWQNLSPVDSNTLEIDEEIILTDLINTELLSSITVSDISTATTADIKWLIFKVKQKGVTNYYDKVLADSLKADTSINQFRNKIGSSNNNQLIDKYSYNWPYDYFSLIEFAKMDMEVIATRKQQSSNTPDQTGVPVDQQI